MQPAVDWDLAARLSARAVRRGGPGDGPEPLPRAERERVVAELRAAAPLAAEHVARLTRLDVAAGGPGAAVVRVVDRASWARANVRSLQALSERVGPPAADRGSRGARRAGGTVHAAQVAAVLGLLSGAVLGQFDPWSAPGTLLLVAPNVLAVERALGVDPTDFRIWVTLHEQTHAQQFAAAPWLADHLAAQVATLLADAPPRRARPGLRGPRSGEPVPGAPRRPRSVLDLLDPRQRVVLDEVGAVMALLEGHADVTMDAVGRSVVPSVRHIRRRFEARRARTPGPVRSVLRTLVGVDVKLAQYRDGAAFVRAVRRRVGTDGLNVVWTAPAALPTAAEIAEPAAWVRRVHG